MAKKGDFWLGIVVGAAAGAVTALLYAPKKGTEVREDIRKSAEEVGQKAGAVWSETKGRASQMSESAKERAHDIAERGKSAVSDVKVKAQEAIRAGREAAKHKRQQLESEVEAEKHKT